MPVGPKDLDRILLNHSQAEIADSIIRRVDTELKQRVIDGSKPIHVRVRLPEVSSDDELRIIMDEVGCQYRSAGWKVVEWQRYDFSFVCITFRAE